MGGNSIHLSIGEVSGLGAFPKPPRLAYVFLNDLCIHAVRQAAVTKLVSDCFKLTSDCALVIYAALSIVLGYAGFTHVG